MDMGNMTLPATNGSADFLWVIVLLVLIGGGNGLGGGECATQSQVRQVSDTSNILNGQDNLQSTFASGLRFVENDINRVENTVQNGFFTAQRDSAELRYALDRCCCEQKLQTCEQTNAIVSAIREDGEATRALFTNTRMRDLESQVNRFQTTNDILMAQGRYVVNPPCPLPCPCNACV